MKKTKRLVTLEKRLYIVQKGHGEGGVERERLFRAKIRQLIIKNNQG